MARTPLQAVLRAGKAYCKSMTIDRNLLAGRVNLDSEGLIQKWGLSLQPADGSVTEPVSTGLALRWSQPCPGIAYRQSPESWNAAQ